jgi:hypothetical protein
VRAHNVHCRIVNVLGVERDKRIMAHWEDGGRNEEAGSGHSVLAGV